MNTDFNSSTSCSTTNNSNLNDDDIALTSIEPANQSDLPTREQRKSIAQIYVEQAKVYCQENNWHKAILACKNALETAPNTADAYKILGDILYRQGKQAEALGIYAKALTIDPNLAAVYANVGALYLDREDWHKALDYYQQAVILDPNLSRAYSSLAQIWEELEDPEKALECFCRAIDLDPTILEAEAYFKFGKELYEQGKIKEASILFIHGVESSPKAEAELSQLVQMLEELGEWQQAVIYYRQLMSLSHGNKDSEIEPNRSRDSSIEKPIKKLLSGSKSFATKVVAKNTQTEIPLLPQNTAQKLLPDVESPVVNNSTVVDVSTQHPIKPQSERPDSALSWNNMGSIYAQKKQWTKAISCYQEALQLEPEFAKSYRNLARVYNHTGEELKAILYWYESFILEPDMVKSAEYFTLATKLIKYQQYQKAIACLRRAVELKPDFEQAQVTLDKILQETIDSQQ